MTTTSIQDRTNEFRSILGQAQKRQSSSKSSAQRTALLSDTRRQEANGAPRGGERRARSEFARTAAQIGRGITATMGKLERLAQREYRFLMRKIRLSDRNYESGSTQNPLRRSACRNLGIDLHHQTRSCLAQFANLLTPKPHAITACCSAQIYGPGRPAQQERRRNASRKGGRRCSGLQGRARSKDEEYPSQSVEDRKLRLQRVVEITHRTRCAKIGIATISVHGHESTTYAAAWQPRSS